MTPLVCLALMGWGDGQSAGDDTFTAAARVLSLHCVRCHNAEKSRGGLDLSTQETALAGGATQDTIVPGQPEESPLVLRARAGSMPPPKDGRRLATTELEALAAWIERGAPWPDDMSLPLAKAADATGRPAPAAVPVRRRLRRPWRR